MIGEEFWKVVKVRIKIVTDRFFIVLNVSHIPLTTLRSTSRSNEGACHVMKPHPQ